MACVRVQRQVDGQRSGGGFAFFVGAGTAKCERAPWERRTIGSLVSFGSLGGAVLRGGPPRAMRRVERHGCVELSGRVSGHTPGPLGLA